MKSPYDMTRSESQGTKVQVKGYQYLSYLADGGGLINYLLVGGGSCWPLSSRRWRLPFDFGGELDYGVRLSTFNRDKILHHLPKPASWIICLRGSSLNRKATKRVSPQAEGQHASEGSK
ncbi:hypothetical protein R1flu_022180 [Riccia fluitans]|uniref:Uncharacterized protein n=1 Tax=Riccia fluitans TaxID=41844 RepID=A0ABD1ZSF5_9MARC